MSSRSGWGLVSFVVGSAFVLGIACSSDDQKNKMPDPPQAGAAGEAETGGKPNAGSGGAPAQAGKGGAVPIAGAAGEGGAPIGAAGVSGAGGAVAACTPSSGVVGLASAGGPPTVCRGERALLPYDATSVPLSFTCCASSPTLSVLDPNVRGTSTVSGPWGFISLLIPNDAADGLQSVGVTCGTDPLTNFAVWVVDGANVPVVTSADRVVKRGDPVTVNGQYLDTVNDMGLESTDPSGGFFACQSGFQGTATLECHYSVHITLGDYRLRVRGNCGYAVNVPTVTVIPENGGGAGFGGVAGTAGAN